MVLVVEELVEVSGVTSWLVGRVTGEETENHCHLKEITVIAISVSKFN